MEDEKDELIRVQTAAADFKAKLIELYREHIELVTRIPVSDSAPAEEAPAVEEPIAEEVAETVEVAEPAVEPTPVEAAEEAAAEHEEQSAPVEEAPAAPVVEENRISPRLVRTSLPSLKRKNSRSSILISESSQKLSAAVNLRG